MYRNNSQELILPQPTGHNWSPPNVWDRWQQFDYMHRLQTTLGSLTMLHLHR